MILAIPECSWNSCNSCSQIEIGGLLAIEGKDCAQPFGLTWTQFETNEHVSWQVLAARLECIPAPF